MPCRYLGILRDEATIVLACVEIGRGRRRRDLCDPITLVLDGCVDDVPGCFGREE